MNYRDLTIQERINFKSWRKDSSPKIMKSDLEDRDDCFDFWNSAKRFNFPDTPSDEKNRNARWNRRFS